MAITSMLAGNEQHQRRLRRFSICWNYRRPDKVITHTLVAYLHVPFHPGSCLVTLLPTMVLLLCSDGRHPFFFIPSPLHFFTSFHRYPFIHLLVFRHCTFVEQLAYSPSSTSSVQLHCSSVTKSLEMSPNFTTHVFLRCCEPALLLSPFVIVEQPLVD